MRKIIYSNPEKVPARGIAPSSDLEQAAWRDFINTSFESTTARDNLKKYNFNDPELRGSSPLMSTTYANMNPDKPGSLPNGHILAPREEMEIILEEDANYFSGIYSDFGLALVTPYDNWDPDDDGKKPNDFVTRNLYEQLQAHEIELTDGGILIPLSVLGRPQENSESAYGLLFKLQDLSSQELKDQIRPLAEYGWTQGWTRDEGLARAFRINRGWFRIDRNLDYSLSDGRVVWAGVVDAPRNLVQGHSDEKWKSALEAEGLPKAYDLAKARLDNN